MVQKLVTINGQVYNQKSVTLSDLQIPELGISQEYLVLSGDGITVDGQTYGSELSGFIIDARAIDESVSGPVTLKRVRIIRKQPAVDKARFYDCELNIRD
jgi:hypothetical protein